MNKHALFAVTTKRGKTFIINEQLPPVDNGMVHYFVRSIDCGDHGVVLQLVKGMPKDSEHNAAVADSAPEVIAAWPESMTLSIQWSAVEFTIRGH